MVRCPAVRLFFALNFSPEVTKAIQQIQRSLRAYAPNALYPGPENLHLTLAFLGEVSPSQGEKARTVLKNLRPIPMTLNFSHLGKFHQRGKELWWLGADPCPQLFQLREDLVSQLKQFGFLLDPKPFKPHVTLARKVEFPGAVPQRNQLLPEPITAPCGTVSLMRSQLTPKGAVYTQLAQQKPGKNPEA